MGLIYGSILPFVDLQFVGRNETATRSWNNVDLAQVHSDVTNFGRVANPCSLATVVSRHAILPYKFTVKIDRTIDYTSYGRSADNVGCEIHSGSGKPPCLPRVTTRGDPYLEKVDL